MGGRGPTQWTGLRGGHAERGDRQKGKLGDKGQGRLGTEERGTVVCPPHSEGAGSEQREEEADRWGARV